MSQNRNSYFCHHYSHHLIDGGAFGKVMFSRDAHGNVLARKSIHGMVENNELHPKDLKAAIYLSKEFLITKLLAGTDVVPKVRGKKLMMQKIGNQHHKSYLPVVRELCLDFVGPTLLVCKQLGFLLEPRDMLLQLLQGLGHIHHLQILHLDLKPDNVTYDLAHRRIKLIDFGLSEMTSHLDLSREGGIVEWRESPTCLPYLPFGEVDNDGVLFPVVRANIPYVQSTFRRSIRGKTILRNPVNIDGYGEPLGLIANTFGLSSSCIYDEKSDIYSAGMIILDYLGVCNVSKVFTYDDQKESQEERLLKWLHLIVSLRGNMNEGEWYRLDQRLVEMADVCENDGYNQKYWLQERIKEELVGNTESMGLYQKMQGVLGSDITPILLDMINPLQDNRPKAIEALYRL